MLRKIMTGIVMSASLLALAGCGESTGHRALTGGAIGAGGGAIIGAATGLGPGAGAAIGGAVGAATGGLTNSKQIDLNNR